MSFLRHRQIYQSDVFLLSCRERSCVWLRPPSHRLDEFAASYSLAGWSPPEPTSASPAGFIFNLPAQTCKPQSPEGGPFFDRQNGEFSTGIDKTRPDQCSGLA